ncbi:hypothetical protein H0H92_015751 [Tricholoma furcatifolium]|nr:hypothetical protein H0H92_015751 [Tricholoma furcatifolium]
MSNNISLPMDVKQRFQKMHHPYTGLKSKYSSKSERSIEHQPRLATRTPGDSQYQYNIKQVQSLLKLANWMFLQPTDRAAFNTFNLPQITSNTQGKDGTESSLSFPSPSLPTRTRFRAVYSSINGIVFDAKVKDSGGPDMMDGAQFFQEMSLAMEKMDKESRGTVWAFWDLAAVNKDPAAITEDLLEGFQELGSILSVLGTSEHLPFECWEDIWIKLPEVEIPFDPSTSARLPVESLTNLCSLRLSGHSRQILDSWLPLTPFILQRLQILHIDCRISLEDCKYVMSNATNVATLSIKCISGPSLSKSFIPPGPPPDVICFPFLDYLDIAAEVNIDDLLESIELPSLRIVSGYLLHDDATSRFQDLKSRNWHYPGRFILRGPFWEREIGSCPLDPQEWPVVFRWDPTHTRVVWSI